MSQIVKYIRADLKANIDKKTGASEQRFFKERITFYGVKVPLVNKIASKYLDQVKHLGMDDIFRLCEELLASDYIEEAFIVSWWLPHFIDRLNPTDVQTFKVWIERYINNWAKCDSFCNHTVGGLLEKYPQTAKEVKSWAKSQNRWLKRAAAVSFVVPAKKGLFLKDAFEISDILLTEKDDLVPKGCGWLLKEESRKHQQEVFNYVLKNKKVMSRTMLRYAIELMPEDLKAVAMEKDSITESL